jgi:proteasome-associated ATPase
MRSKDILLGFDEVDIMADDLLTAVREEFKENEDLPKIAGKKGERIVSVRPLTTEVLSPSRSVEQVVTTGQYL